MKQSLWIYDDLWEEGYRFDDIINNLYVMISREFACDEYSAMEFLDKAYDHIKKIDGTSNAKPQSAYVYSNALFMYRS